ncbi:MAG TPA: FlgD immunoglobulin-like domain containing protein, partial [bacterium]|nr:FlgD immunoglobulin-like domain containing protein [bacterium]
TTLGVLTNYADTVSWNDDFWVDYDFIWDAQSLHDGDQIDLKATVTDHVGNEQVAQIWLKVAAEAPILTLSIPEAKDVCSEKRVKGDINIVATEKSETNPIDTYYVGYIYKKSTFPDLGDCNAFDDQGWVMCPDTLMIEGHNTSETIWRATMPTSKLADGSYDIALVTIDVAGNYSWDMNRDWCVDAGYFGQCVANGMGMTVVVQNHAPELRIRKVNNFEAVDEGLDWAEPVYVQVGQPVTVTSVAASTCDIAKVDYYLSGEYVIDGWRGPVHVGTSTDAASGYQVTFPPTGGLEQYFEPNAFQNGYAMVDLIAIVTDLLGNVTQEATYAMVPIWVLKVAPSSAFVTQPSPGEYVRSWVNIEGDVLDNEAVYDITYEYRAVGATDWITIAQTKPHCGDPWNKDVNNAIIKWNTDLLADGDYQLRAVSRDANLTVDTNPSVITVHVDNTAPTITAFNLSPTYTVGEALPTAPSTYIGGPHVELSATGSDAGGIDHVHFMYKAIDADIDSATALYRDDEAPYAYDWICGFPQVPSGWYDFIVKIEDKAGNETYQTQRVYVDQYAPFGWIGHISWKKGTQTIDDQTPDNSNFYGVLDINGTCKDDAPASACLDGHNQKFDSGLKAAQFQYQPVTGGGYLGVATGAESQSVPNPNAWIDLGEQVVGTGPDYAINWDTGTLVPGKYYVRIVGIDNVDNRADVDGAPSLPYITINIVDQIAPKAIIAGVDDVSGYIWATADTHGQDDVKFVRFEYRPATATAEWTVIGVVDTTMCKGLYGVPWHFASIGPGNYWVRAVAYDDDYDVVNFPDLYDQNPAMMYVTVTADYKVTMASTSYISSLTRWGSLSDYTEVGVKAVCAAGEPTVIVVFDNDPEDHYNVPRVKLLSLERPDDPAQWVDQFWFGQLGDWGVATIIGTYNNSGTVGAKTSTVKVYRVTDAEGTKGVVSQDSMSVDIPAGVIRSDSEGLLVINTPRPFAQPTLLDVTPVGPAVMMKFLGGGENDDNRIFDNGYRADVTLAYRQGEITSSMVESNLRPAWWDGVNAQWQYSGITNVSVNTSTNVVTFKANHTGTFTVVSATTFRITQPVYYPGCKVGGVTYTSKFPKFASVIEDVINGLNEPEIKVTIDGPAGDKIFDNLTLYYHGDAIWPWIKAEYDEIGHILGIAVDPGYSWGEGDYRWGAGAWNGLPGGQYTLKIEALNAVGDKKSLTDVFTVDAGVPTVDFAGTYVAANPSFTLNVGDALSGVDPATVFLDVYAIRANGYQTENKEYLGTATPSAMSYDGGTVTFGNMTFHETLGDNMSIDVIVYDGHVPSDTGTQVIYNGCTDEDDHQCRSYYSEQGIADCVGNHANPVWRRFTVDATCPTMTLVSKESDQDIEVKVEDDISGIPWNIEGEQTPFDIKVDGEAFYDYTFVPTSNNHVGTLRFTVGAGAAKIEVTARDAVGNFCVLEINKGAEVVDVTDVKSYPNPFDPGSGQYTTISFDLTKKADVLIKIFDFAGEYVTTVADGWYDPGTHTINWFGTDGNGKTVASGAYIGYVKIDDGSKVIARNLKIGVGAKCCSGD